MIIRSTRYAPDGSGAEDSGRAQHRSAAGDQRDRRPLHLAHLLVDDDPRQQDRHHAEGRGNDHGDVRRSTVGPGKEGDIAERIEAGLQADKGNPFRRDMDRRPLREKNAGDEDEAGPAADPHGLRRPDQRRCCLAGEHDGDVSETGADGDEHSDAIALGLGLFRLGHRGPRNEHAAGNNDGHRRPLHCARPQAHQHIHDKHERRMRGDNRHHDGDGAARDAHVKQDAHHRHGDSVEKCHDVANWRPDELRARGKEPDCRAQRPNEEHRGIIQRRAERPGAEARHEIRRAKAKRADKSEKGRDHASFAL